MCPNLTRHLSVLLAAKYCQRNRNATPVVSTIGISRYLPYNDFNFPLLGLGRLLRGVFFGPLLFPCVDVFGGGWITTEGVFDVAVSGLPNLVGIAISDLYAHKHTPGEIACFILNEFNTEGA